jgi:hypothetical protein
MGGITGPRFFGMLVTFCFTFTAGFFGLLLDPGFAM